LRTHIINKRKNRRWSPRWEARRDSSGKREVNNELRRKKKRTILYALAEAEMILLPRWEGGSGNIGRRRNDSAARKKGTMPDLKRGGLSAIKREARVPDHSRSALKPLRKKEETGRKKIKGGW